MCSQDIDFLAQLADLKDIDYRNTLAIATLIELFIEKGLCSRQEFTRKARELDAATINEINNMRVNIVK
jgi:hypothetical protein